MRQCKTMLAGWVLVLAYVCTLPPAVPLAFAALAKLEGSHGVEIHGASGSQTTVVLTHQKKCAGQGHEAIHHHCLAARMLAAFSQPAGDGDPDHVVKFVSGANRLTEERVTTEEPTVSLEAVAPGFVVVQKIEPPQMAALVVARGVPRWGTAPLRTRSSTLLLI